MGKPVRDRAPTRLRRFAAALVFGLILTAPVVAGEAVVEGVEVSPLGGDRFRISVAVRHGDEGWDHYADRWTVLDEADGELGERVLAHPHVDEQPFTRSKTIEIPASVRRIRVRAGDSVHGEGAASDWVDVPR